MARTSVALLQAAFVLSLSTLRPVTLPFSTTIKYLKKKKPTELTTYFCSPQHLYVMHNIISVTQVSVQFENIHQKQLKTGLYLFHQFVQSNVDLIPALTFLQNRL